VRIVSDRRYQFDFRPDALWSAIAETDRYPDWWSWLTEFDADALVTGDVWLCRVRPPLPYTLRFAIHLDEVVEPVAISAHLSGDIVGRARIDVAPHDEGSEVRLRAALAPGNRAFALIARMARPLIERGHDWVLDTGAAQFAHRAVESSAPLA
jgi:hypothetical protein